MIGKDRWIRLMLVSLAAGILCSLLLVVRLGAILSGGLFGTGSLVTVLFFFASFLLPPVILLGGVIRYLFCAKISAGKCIGAALCCLLIATVGAVLSWSLIISNILTIIVQSNI